MKDDMINTFEKDMAVLLPMVSSGTEALGDYGKDVLAIAGECRDIIDAMKEESGMDEGVLEARLKMVSEQISKTIQVLTKAHAGAHKTMASIGNRKRIQKAYDREMINYK